MVKPFYGIETGEFMAGNSRIKYFIKIIPAILFYVIGIAMLAGYFTASNLLPQDRESYEDNMCFYEGEWYREYQDGTKEAVEIPQKFTDLKAGDTLIISTVLPKNIENNTYFCYRSSHQSVKIYVNGIEYLSYDTTDKPIYGNNSASRYLFLGLKPYMSAGTLRMEITGNTSYIGVVMQPYMGEALGIWSYLLFNHSRSTLMGIVIGIISIFFLVMCLLLSAIFKRHFKLVYLVWAELWFSIWVLCESRFRQAIFPNNSLAANFAFLCIPMICFAIILYVDYMQENRYHSLYRMGYITLILVLGACIGLHSTLKMDLLQTMYYNYAGCSIACIPLFISIRRDIKKDKYHDYIAVIIGCVLALMGAVLELIFAITHSTMMTGLCMGIGLFNMFLCGACHTCLVLLKEEREKRRIENLSESKDIFLASMSHEIRTPINSILGMNQLILRENSDPQIREYAENIDRAGVMLLGLVNDILDFSKIGSGKLELIKNNYSTATVIKDLSLMVSERAADKGLKFIVDADENIPKRLAGDHMRIKQIVTNILTNAIKYTKEGSVTLKVSYEKQEDNNILLCIKVSDTGQGIKKENLDKIFSAFTRVEERTNQSIEGTGLGLAITKQLVELMGGNIFVESEFGKGSVFTINIPQEIVDPLPMGDVSKEGRKEYSASKDYRCLFFAPEAKILAVDDNSVNLAVVKGLLKTSGAKIDTAKSGDLAIELCRKEKYDVILMDHMMPDKDGVETFHELTKIWKNNSETPVPTIALTANAIAGMKEQYLNEGFADYLSKPIDCEKLERMMIKYIPSDKLTMLE